MNFPHPGGIILNLPFRHDSSYSLVISDYYSWWMEETADYHGSHLMLELV